ncbi:hypothetical protein B0H13DRAFT_2404887 [Mycena leptocephala]|nr:hypothetical protein B0H13DRAFT_2404887 [Mycena leptocephala]
MTRIPPSPPQQPRPAAHLPPYPADERPSARSPPPLIGRHVPVQKIPHRLGEKGRLAARRSASVVALSLAFKVDLALALCESSDFDFDFLAAALEDVEEASAVAALTPCVKLPLTVAAMGRSLVPPPDARTHRSTALPAGRPRLVDSGCVPASELEEVEEGGGVDAEKWRSERVRAGWAAWRKISIDRRRPVNWRKRGSFEVVVGDMGGLANVGEAGVGG